LFRAANDPYSAHVNALPPTLLDSNPTVIVGVVLVCSIIANIVDKWLTVRSIRRGS
jgi:hypothetical protein